LVPAAGAAEVAEVSIPQLPLAMFGDTSFGSAAVDGAPGDLFVLLTDGPTEVFDRVTTSTASIG
jgi:serine phosphatase RsbU (regulator of sigma subunit)